MGRPRGRGDLRRRDEGPDLAAAAAVFIGIALLIGIVALVGGTLNRPDCPDGQVWQCRTSVSQKVTTTTCRCDTLPGMPPAS